LLFLKKKEDTKIASRSPQQFRCTSRSPSIGTPDKYQKVKKWQLLKPKQYYVGNEIEELPRTKTPEMHKSRFRLINYGFPEHGDQLKIENTRLIKTA
jgi:hypothetical protein